MPTVFVNGVECAYAAPQGRLQISESSTEEGPRVTIVYAVDWADRWPLVRALRGICVLDGSGGFARTPPYQLPAQYGPPDGGPLVCTAVGEFQYVGGLQSDESGEQFGQIVHVPATFSCVPWQFVDGDPAGQNDPSGQAWTVTKGKPSTQVFQPPGGTYYVGPFAPTGAPLDDANVAFYNPQNELQVIRKFLPRLYLDAFNSALGCANSVAMKFGDHTYGIADLLLLGLENEPYTDCVGNPVCDVILTFAGKIASGDSWQAVRTRDGSFHELNTKADGTGSKPLVTYDMTTLPR
jgi:hypothetical protein